MAQLNDLVVTGKSRFLNDINANVTGTASNVTGTVAIANGGTGATTRLGAAKALTDETVPTPGFVVGLTDNWGKFGYTSIANLKTTLGAMTPASHTHGNIQNGGTLQTTDITIASGDKLVVTDSSDSAKIARTSISFDGSTTTKCLTQKGTWETFGTSNLTLGTTSTTALKGDTKYAGASTAGGSATSAQKLKFIASSTDVGCPIAFCTSENPISQGDSIEYAGVHSNLKFNPSSNVLTIGVNNSDYPKSFTSITYNSTNPQINVTYQPNVNTLNSSVLSKSGLSVTQNASALNIAYNDLTFSASSNPPTWDGTNTSLVTAVTDKLSKSNGGTVSGDLTITGDNGLILGTSSTSSNDSADIIFNYGSGTEKARIWTETTMNNAGSILHYRYNNSSGTNVFSGYIMTSEVQSAQVSVSVLSNNIMMYKCGRIVYFSIIGDYNASLPSRVITTVGSVTATDWQPITTCDSGLKGHNNQVSMQITSTGSVTMYNYTTSAVSSGWFRWSGCYITKS